VARERTVQDAALEFTMTGSNVFTPLRQDLFQGNAVPRCNPRVEPQLYIHSEINTRTRKQGVPSIDGTRHYFSTSGEKNAKEEGHTSRRHENIRKTEDRKRKTFTKKWHSDIHNRSDIQKN
jgi:hypothetical protein